MPKQKKLKVFSTIDMGLASALSTKGFQMIETELIDRAVHFYFQQDEGIEDMARKYYMSDILVNAKDIVAEMKKLRKIIGAHLSSKYGPIGLSEKEIDHKYEDEEKPTTKKKNKGNIALGNDGFTPL